MTEPPYPGYRDLPTTTEFARIDPAPKRRIGVLSAVFTACGAVQVVIAFTALRWFPGQTGSGATPTFSELHKLLGQLDAVAQYPARLYFGWLGWGLLAAAALTSSAAALPMPGAPFRMIGALVSTAAIVMTFIAIDLFKNIDAFIGTHQGYSTYLKHAQVGFYCAVGGFLLLGVGAVIGPSRRRG